jgi:hypothetical protein
MQTSTSSVGDLQVVGSSLTEHVASSELLQAFNLTLNTVTVLVLAYLARKYGQGNGKT